MSCRGEGECNETKQAVYQQFHKANIGMILRDMRSAIEAEDRKLGRYCSEYPDGAIMGIRRSQNTEPAGISQWLWTGIQRYQLLHRRAVPSDDFIDMEMWKILTSRLSMEISAASPHAASDRHP